MNNDFIEKDAAIMSIGTIAKGLGVHVRTLRIYDEEGILPPSRIVNQRRYYSIKDAERAKLILFLTRSLSINLIGVKLILAMLKKAKVGPDKQYDYILKMCESAEISKDVLEDNYTRNSGKGRKTTKTDKTAK